MRDWEKVFCSSSSLELYAFGGFILIYFGKTNRKIMNYGFEHLSIQYYHTNINIYMCVMISLISLQNIFSFILNVIDSFFWFVRFPMWLMRKRNHFNSFFFLFCFHFYYEFIYFNLNLPLILRKQ